MNIDFLSFTYSLPQVSATSSQGLNQSRAHPAVLPQLRLSKVEDIDTNLTGLLRGSNGIINVKMPKVLSGPYWLLVKTAFFPSFLPNVSYHIMTSSLAQDLTMAPCGPQTQILTLSPVYQSTCNHGLSSDLAILWLSYLCLTSLHSSSTLPTS